MKADVCNRCGCQLDSTDWHPSASKRRWLICKLCANQRLREYNQTNPERAFKKNMQRRYGITFEEYSLMLTNQDYACAICGKEESSSSRTNLSIDHDHITNKIRGLLCTECNIGLGKFKDDVTLLQKAIEYINAL